MIPANINFQYIYKINQSTNWASELHGPNKKWVWDNFDISEYFLKFY